MFVQTTFSGNRPAKTPNTSVRLLSLQALQWERALELLAEMRSLKGIAALHPTSSSFKTGIIENHRKSIEIDFETSRLHDFLNLNSFHFFLSIYAFDKTPNCNRNCHRGEDSRRPTSCGLNLASPEIFKSSRASTCFNTF